MTVGIMAVDLTNTSAHDLAQTDNCCTDQSLASTGDFDMANPTVVHHCLIAWSWWVIDERYAREFAETYRGKVNVLLLNAAACPASASSTENCKSGLPILNFKSSPFVTQFQEFHQSAVYAANGSWVGSIRDVPYGRYEYTEEKAIWHEKELEIYLKKLGVEVLHDGDSTDEANGAGSNVFALAPLLLCLVAAVSM